MMPFTTCHYYFLYQHFYDVTTPSLGKHKLNRVFRHTLTYDIKQCLFFSHVNGSHQFNSQQLINTNFMKLFKTKTPPLKGGVLKKNYLIDE